MQFDTQDRGHVQCAGCNPVTAEYAGVPAILAYIMLETGRPEITIRHPLLRLGGGNHRGDRCRSGGAGGRGNDSAGRNLRAIADRSRQPGDSPAERWQNPLRQISPGGFYGYANYCDRTFGTAGVAACADTEAVRTQAAVAVGVDDPQCQPHPAEPRWAESRRPSGVVRLLHLHHDRIVSGDGSAAGPHRGEAARRPGVPRHELPVRPPDH